MVRRYLARLARRYAPMAVALAALVLVLTLVPSINQSGQHVQATGSGGSGSMSGGTGAGGAGNVAVGAGATGPGSTVAGAGSGWTDA